MLNSDSLMLSRKTSLTPVAAIVLLALTTACHSWQPLPMEQQIAPLQSSHRARLELVDGRTLTVDHVRVEGDSVIGVKSGQEMIREPLTGVRHVFLQKSEPLRTGYLITGLAGLAATTTIMIATIRTPKPLTLLERCSQTGVNCDFP